MISSFILVLVPLLLAAMAFPSPLALSAGPLERCRAESAAKSVEPLHFALQKKQRELLHYIP